MAYNVSGGKWPQPGGFGTPVTITYSYENVFDGGLRGPGAVPKPNGMYLPNGPSLSNTLIRESIEEALSLWASVAPFRFVEHIFPMRASHMRVTSSTITATPGRNSARARSPISSVRRFMSSAIL
jgi:hypothetical protein